jgi:hypothetical protein
MNTPFSGERLNHSEIDAQADLHTDIPAVISDPFAMNIPIDAAVISDLPVSETMTNDEAVSSQASVIETPPYHAPVSETIIHEAPAGVNAGSPTTVLNREESEHFRARWNEIQGKFVDEPRDAVQEADALVTEVVAQIAQMFANEHSSLESQWNQGNVVSTEDLRKALQHYRTFFNRLVV